VRERGGGVSDLVVWLKATRAEDAEGRERERERERERADGWLMRYRRGSNVLSIVGAPAGKMMIMKFNYVNGCTV
jgi:hypothetical protein